MNEITNSILLLFFALFSAGMFAVFIDNKFNNNN